MMIFLLAIFAVGSASAIDYSDISIKSDFTATSNFATLSICKGNTYVGAVRIYNKNPSYVGYEIYQIDDTTQSWSSVVPNSFVLGPYESQTITHYINPPVNAKGKFTSELLIKTQDTSKVLTQELNVQGCLNMEVDIDDFSFSNCPCTPTVYNFKLKNTGEYTDTFDLFVDLPRDYYTISSNPVVIPPGQEKEVFVYVTMPCDVYGNYSFNFYTDSKSSGFRTKTPFYLTLRQECYDFDVVLGHHYQVRENMTDYPEFEEMPEDQYYLCQNNTYWMPFMIWNKGEINNQFFYEFKKPSFMEMFFIDPSELTDGQKGYSGILAYPDFRDSGDYNALLKIMTGRGDIEKTYLINSSVVECSQPPKKDFPWMAVIIIGSLILLILLILLLFFLLKNKGKDEEKEDSEKEKKKEEEVIVVEKTKDSVSKTESDKEGKPFPWSVIIVPLAVVLVLLLLFYLVWFFWPAGGITTLTNATMANETSSLIESNDTIEDSQQAVVSEPELENQTIEVSQDTSGNQTSSGFMSGIWESIAGFFSNMFTFAPSNMTSTNMTQEEVTDDYIENIVNETIIENASVEVEDNVTSDFVESTGNDIQGINDSTIIVEDSVESPSLWDTILLYQNYILLALLLLLLLILLFVFLGKDDKEKTKSSSKKAKKTVKKKKAKKKKPVDTDKTFRTFLWVLAILLILLLAVLFYYTHLHRQFGLAVVPSSDNVSYDNSTYDNSTLVAEEELIPMENATSYVWKKNYIKVIDFSKYVIDEDDEEITLLVPPVENLSIETQNMKVYVTPEKDWFGQRIMTVIAEDEVGNRAYSPDILLTVLNQDPWYKIFCNNIVVFFSNYLNVIVLLLLIVVVSASLIVWYTRNN